ncbi:MAG: hypothetical protein RJA22_2936 [Verrucomicrobiota bacterium]|jgi:polar amino acid transport system substrate-binding protein
MLRRFPAFLLLLATLGACLALAGCGREALRIQRLEDAAHARIGVMTGSTGEAITKARFPHAHVKSFDDIMDAVAALKSGQLDAFVTGWPAATQVGKKNPDLRLLPERLADEDTAVALRQEDKQLLAEVDALITRFKADGTLESMRRRWFKPDLGPYDEPALVLPTAGPVLRIGVSATREPFSFVDQDGRVSGHDGELARRLAAGLNRPVEFLNMKFMALIPALQSGKVDLIVTGMNATEERRKAVAFSQSYFANGQVMVIRTPAGPADPGRLRSVEDLTRARLGVLLGSAHDTYATRHYPDATVLQYKTAADVVLAVKSGKVDAALFDAEPLREILRAEPGLGLLGDPLFSFDVAAGFSKDNAALRAEFNAFLRQLRADGAYQDMVTRWMEKRDTHPPALPAGTPRGRLVAGVCDVGLPFTAVQDGALVGFDIELARRFAQAQGRDLELVNMEFGSLVAAVATRKVDFIIASIYVTPERQQQIDFSDPYFQMGTRVFALQSRLAGGHAAANPARPPFWERVAHSFRSNVLHERRYLLILDGLKTTVVISLCATLLGTLLGAGVCALRLSRRPWLNGPARLYISVLRGMPVLVLLMLIFYVVFASVNVSPILVSIVAFALNFAAYSSEVFRSGIQGIDRGQSEAGIAMGFTRFQTFRHILLPQTIQRILPVYKGEFISLVKMTSIVGYIAVQDLTKASDIIRSRTFDAFFPIIMVALLYFAISWSLLQGLGWIERVTDPKLRRRRAAAAP